MNPTSCIFDPGYDSQMFEAHYCGLESQSNIYGLCKIELPSRATEILVASLRGKNGPKVVSLGICNTNPFSKEVRFTYIPGDAEIISIDALNKFHHGNNVVVGITFIKTLDDKPHYYLNIYSEWAATETFDLDSIAQGCYNIELSFIPYQLTHAEYVHDGNVETVFLLSGSDHRIHVYREDKYLQNIMEEVCVDKCFPEFENLHGSNVTRLETKYFCDYQRRLAALGFLDGWISVSLVNTKTASVIKTWNIQHDSPVTSVKIFTLKTDVDCPHFVTEVMDSLEDTVDCCFPDFHLLVTSAVEVAVIYRSILSKGFTDPVMLQHSDRFDSVLCACTADVDMDGQHEIILGTYGQEMLVYKFVSDDTEDDRRAMMSQQYTDEQTKQFKRTPSSRSLPKNKSNSSLISNDDKDSIPKCPVHKVDSRASIKSSASSTSTGAISSDKTRDIALASRDHFTADLEGTVTSPTECGDITTENKSEAAIIEVPNQHKINEVVAETKIPQSQLNNTLLIDKEINSIDSSKNNLSELDSLSLRVSKENINLNVDGTVPDGVLYEQTDTLCDGSYELIWKKSFAEPVFAIDSMDLIGDGLEELVILTLKGLHVLQHDPQKATALCLERLKLATQQHEAHNPDVFKQLLSETLVCQHDPVSPLETS